jgi:MGT family glycosyltransferase
MTLLLISPDYASHVLPLLSLARAWADEGERVVVATGRAVAPLVERAGFERIPLVLGRGSNGGVARPGDQPVGEDDHLRAFFRATRAGMVPTLRLQAELRRNDLLWRPVEAARATIAAVEAIRPDVVLVDHLAYSARLGLEAAGIRYADVVLGHPTALPVGDERYGVPDAWPSAFRPDPAGMADLRVLANDVADRFTADWNRALTELDSGGSPVPDAFRTHGDPVLFSYSAQLHDAARILHLPERHCFLGSAGRDEALDAEAAAWIASDDRPIVVVSFGSFLSARADVLAVVAAGLRLLDVRVALATGSADAAMLGELPAAWLVRPVLPQVGLVAHAAVAITHGGNNGVTEALTHGVPVLALPFSTDQFAVAADLERSGFGRAHDPNRLTADEVRAAVESLVDGRESTAAADLGRALRADPGPARARRAISSQPSPAAMTS